MPVHPLCRRVRDGPIGATYGDRPANEKEQAMMRPKNEIRVVTISFTFLLLSIFEQTPVLNQIIVYDLSFVERHKYISH